MDTNERSNISLGIIIVALLKKGIKVLLPFSSTEKYDLVIDYKGKLSRVQVKTAWLSEGKIIFNAHSMHSRTRIKRKYLPEEVDFFAIYSPDLDKVYVMPLSEVKSNMPYLRIEQPKNGYKKNIRYAKDYSIDLF